MFVVTGVNPIKAGKFRKEEVLVVSDKEADKKDIFEEQRDPETDKLLVYICPSLGISFYYMVRI